jgi:hypothetical protein
MFTENLMAFDKVVKHHNGKNIQAFQGAGYVIFDLEFPTREDGMHFGFAVNQAWRHIVTRVQYITTYDDGAVLYTVTVDLPRID